MAQSVTQFIKEFDQPDGGVLPVDLFDSFYVDMRDNYFIKHDRVDPAIMGVGVDYMSRWLMSADFEGAFITPLSGAHIISELSGDNYHIERAAELSDIIKYTRNKQARYESVLRLCAYDQIARGGGVLVNIDEVNPEDTDIAVMERLVKRVLKFLDKFGPIVLDGFNFDGGYTDTITHGEGDFLTDNTLWDMKTIRRDIGPYHTLQLLMYWRMGLRSQHRELFRGIQFLGIYNPRSNKIHRCPTSNIPQDAIDLTDFELIGY